MTKPTVLIMAGGTGGHVFPALAVAESLKANGVAIEWLGTRRGIESRLVPEAGFKLHYLNIAGLRGKGWKDLLLAPWKITQAIVQSLAIVKKLKPICVLGMGGFASGPGGVAAWLTRTPLVIHEQNAVAGTTNRLLAKIADRVMLAYPGVLSAANTHYVGNPVRSEIAKLEMPEKRYLARENTPLQLLIVGGSLGAKVINETVPEALALLAENERPIVWHQSGPKHINTVKEHYQELQLQCRVEAFIEDMAEAYQWADVVVCRAGALTVAELAAAGVASLLIPLPHAIDDHQTENARWLSANNAGELLAQKDLTAAILAEKIRGWKNDKTALSAIANSARTLAKTDAAEKVAETCMGVAHAR